MTEATTAHLDLLITQVIDDANTRGAHIAEFRVLTNGKVVLYFEPSRERLPQYFGTRFCVVDALIHRYNLKRNYRFLYERTSKVTKRATLQETSESDNEETQSLENQAIKRCDEILWHHNAYELLSLDRHMIYNALGSINAHSRMRHMTFTQIKKALLEHYRRKSENTLQVVDKVKLKKIVKFFNDLEYHDIL